MSYTHDMISLMIIITLHTAKRVYQSFSFLYLQKISTNRILIDTQKQYTDYSWPERLCTYTHTEKHKWYFGVLAIRTNQKHTDRSYK